MPKLVLFLVSVVLLTSCSSYMQEAKRYKISSLEGRFIFDDPIKLKKKEAFDVIEEWVELEFNPELTTIKKTSTAPIRIIINGLAPVAGRSTEEYCRYRLTISVEAKKLRTQFETMQLTDQFYPSKNNIKKLKTYYEKMHKDIKKTLDEFKK